MRKTAKSIIAALLTLVMLLSSVVVFSVSGIAAEAQESYQFKPTALYCYDLNENNSNLAKMVGNNFTTVSEKRTDKEYGINAFFNDEGMKKIAPYTYADGVFTQVPSVNIGLSFTLSTTGSENLPSLRIYLSGRNSNDSSTTTSPDIITFGSSVVKVLGTEICGYGDGQHDIYLDINIASFQTASSSGSLTVTVFVDGEYRWEKTARHSMYALKHATNENVFAFKGSCMQDGNDMSLENLTCYVNMPKAKPITGKAPTGVSQFGTTTAKYSDGKYTVSSNTKASVKAFFTGVSELTNLRGHSGTKVDVSKLGMSFKLEGNPISVDGTDTYPIYAIRFYHSTAYFYDLINFGSEGTVKLLGENQIASLADRAATIYLDMDIKWASANGVRDGFITVRAYVNGTYLGEYGKVFTLAETRVGTASEPALQLSGGGVIGTHVFSNVEFYFGETADSYEGASMRLVGGAETSGLRFELGVNKTFFDSFGGKATVGALIIPTDKLPGGHFSEAALEGLVAGKDYIVLDDCGFSENATEASENGDYVYYASIVGIKDKNMARSFTGVGYVKLADGRCVYTCQQNRSIYEVAKNATASGDYESKPTDKAKIAAYLDKVVVLETADGKLSLVTFENYTSPYALDESTATTFVLSGAVDGITTIVVDGVVFTKGWDIAGGKLSAALPSAE